jgi:hypothetical protein
MPEQTKSYQITDPAQGIDALLQMLKAGEDAINEGQHVDWFALESFVKELCAQVVKTEGAVRMRLIPHLENAIAKLDQLEQKMRANWNDLLASDLAQKRMQAQGAYGKSGQG